MPRPDLEASAALVVGSGASRARAGAQTAPAQTLAAAAAAAAAVVRETDQATNGSTLRTAERPIRRRTVRRTDHATPERLDPTPGRSAVGPLVRRTDRARPIAASRPRRERAGGAARSDRERPVAASRALVIGCGALARELLAVAERIPGLEIACLPPDLHNHPDGIPGAVRARIAAARRDGHERIFIAYADCGTGGLLEPVLAEAGVERLPGAHCYEVFAGSAAFAALADAEPGTFWLTDFLARNFERLVIRGLGIDRHPELQATYFAHYTRVVFLSQTDDPDLLILARRAAERLGLPFEHRPTGIANLATPILAFARAGVEPRGVAAGGPH